MDDSRRLRVAVLSRHFSSQGGGAERYAVSVAAQLATQHEVHVFAQHFGPALAGLTYHRISQPLAKPRWINQLWFAWATWRATRTGFDVVHSHENTWHGQVQTVHVLPVRHTLLAGKTGLAKALRWLKIVTSPRLLAYWWLEHVRMRVTRRRCIVSTSSTLQNVLQGAYPYARGAMEVIAPGIAAVVPQSTPKEQRQARAALQLPAEGVMLLFVGNDWRKKGLSALLEALHSLPLHVSLMVVGQGEHNAALRAQVQELGLGARVHFVGSLQQMEPAYRAADMLVHPTLEDTYAMVVLEALAHSLPVVVSGPQHCGISAELSHGVHALMVDDPRDASALAHAIRCVLEDHGLAQRLSAQGAQWAASRTWEQVGAQYAALYARVAPRFTQRWLVLSHAFNMDGRAASQTITDKLPHLEAAGIEVVVLSGVSGRPDTRVEHHQLWPAGPAGIRFELRHVLRQRFSHAGVYRAVMVALSLPLLPFMLIEKLLRPVESSWSWWWSAYLKGRSLARQRKFDVIYSTGGAFAAHVAGRALKRALGLPWLAEVHDPLVMPGSTPHTAQERMQAEVERMICTDADVAVWFTEQALASARQRHPQLGERGKMMLPGIDAPFAVLPPYVPGPKMVIGHFGSLSATRNLTPILAALEALVAQRPELRTKIELQVTGGPLDAVSQAYLAHSAVQDMVRHLGRIEADPVTGLSGREQILRRMRSADVLLLLHGTEPICAEYIPSKMYEYLWMQRPILATVHGNAQMAALLRGQGHMVVETQISVTLSTEEVSHPLASAVEQLFAQWEQQGLEDSGQSSPFTTEEAVHHLLAWSTAPGTVKAISTRAA
jgi:glycosyltransferase involved in cell wall biosynthesis